MTQGREEPWCNTLWFPHALTGLNCVMPSRVAVTIPAVPSTDLAPIILLPASLLTPGTLGGQSSMGP